MLASRRKYAEQLNDVEQERMKVRVCYIHQCVQCPLQLGEDANVRTTEDVKARIAQARSLLNSEQYERDSLRGGACLLLIVNLS